MKHKTDDNSSNSNTSSTSNKITIVTTVTAIIATAIIIRSIDKILATKINIINKTSKGK